ncbi:MAG TPA: NADH dehydrogenase subunit E, partial [Nordella sp.]|nr:NADH dehydrogenase subunit E [Nordella sp.]
DSSIYSNNRTFTRIETPLPAAPAAAAPPAAPAAAAKPAAAAPPSDAAKPETAAPETAPAVKSPSPVKTQEAPAALAKLDAKAKATSASENAAERAAPKAESKPELLTEPKAGKADDLKLIWGVGPKLEQMLHEMGVWHFDQIASWTEAELNWVDGRLEGFHGRAERDKWVEQAKKLATGWRPDNAVGEKPGK